MTFKDKLKQLVRVGVQDINDLSDQQKCDLTAAYMRETPTHDRWDFILEPDSSYTRVPRLLIDVLENNRNGDYSLYPPEITLATMMAKAAVDCCMDIIDDTLQSEISDQLLEASIERQEALSRKRGQRHDS